MRQLFQQVSALNDKFNERSLEDGPLLFHALVAGEDRRARYHFGIDVISIIRSLFNSLKSGRISGLSTIEQQLVRALIPRKASPLQSKPKELALAVVLASRFPKETIWAAYLEAAFLGAEWDDFRSARVALAGTGPLDTKGACAIIACLKYPKPEAPDSSWPSRHTRRVAHLEWLIETGRGRFNSRR